MSAHKIFERAPVGAIISWRDGKPQPLPSETEARAAWQQQNGRGRLVGKTSRSVMGQSRRPAGFKVMIETSRSDGGSDEPEFRRFSIECDLSFVIAEWPSVGSCRIFSSPGEDAELVHLASSRTHAQTWINNLGSRHMVMADVTADEIAADHIEGRTEA